MNTESEVASKYICVIKIHFNYFKSVRCSHTGHYIQSVAKQHVLMVLELLVA